MYLLTEASAVNLFDPTKSAARLRDLRADYITLTGDDVDEDATEADLLGLLESYYQARDEDREHQRAEWRAKNGR